MRKNKPLPRWENSIKNPANKEYGGEVAFNLGKRKGGVTQEEFNKRYGVVNDSMPTAKSIITKKRK